MPYASWSNPLASPFEVAAERARPLGLCPVNMLEDFYTNHWDHDSLCACFDCRECVASPEDLGYFEDWDDAPCLDSPASPGDEEIPF